MIEHPLVLAGQYGSPYTLKMRAVLRYRQISFRWVLRGSKWDDLPAPPVPIIPVIAYPNADGSHGDGGIHTGRSGGRGLRHHHRDDSEFDAEGLPQGDVQGLWNVY